jgi:hypothetical protein
LQGSQFESAKLPFTFINRLFNQRQIVLLKIKNISEKWQLVLDAW